MSPQPLTGEAFRDHENVGPRPTHDIANGGVFSIYSETPINAPPKAVYDAILDVRHWKEWNTFVPDVTITSHPHNHHKQLRMEEGTFMTFHVQMTPTEKRDSKETVTLVERLKTEENHPSMPRVTRIRWNMHNAGYLAPGFLIKAQRVNEIEETAEGTVIYRTWQTFGGWAANTIKKKYEQALKDNFANWCRDLKAYVEEQSASGGAVRHVAHSETKAPAETAVASPGSMAVS